MALRLIFCLTTAILWAVITVWWLPLGWVLVGAAIIGMLYTIGLEPPRLVRRVLARVLA